MAVLQPLVDIPAICYAHGIRHAVISPGSRSAPLTLAFARHGGFTIEVCMDERSGGFIALGIAQQTGLPVVLICTSGSAAYNFAPAVSEAFFQHIPMLVLTADRPKEWSHQYDGQTIYQNEIFGKHVKKSWELPADYAHKDSVWATNRLVNEAIIASTDTVPGPVHLNVPVREPFYPLNHEELRPSEAIRIVRKATAEPTLSSLQWNDLLDTWADARRILIVGGQTPPNSGLVAVLKKISEELHVPVVADCITNLPGGEFIRHQDLFLHGNKDVNLEPDLLITFGLSTLSKDLKMFLRQNPAKTHWQIGIDSVLADPFQSITELVAVNPLHFFKNLFEKIDYQQFVENQDGDLDTEFQQLWVALEASSGRYAADYLDDISKLNDLTLVDCVLKYSFERYQLHFGNSMAIRYANAFGVESPFGVFANRGTSGIDGCVSTAIGAAKVNGLPTLLIVGDVSFLYDRNGLLIRQLPDNLKIVVINNAGGNIFRMIDGPGNLPELPDYFETRHSFTAKRTCEDSNIAYFEVSQFEDLHLRVQAFLDFKGIALLEGFTDPLENEAVWKAFRQGMNS